MLAVSELTSFNFSLTLSFANVRRSVPVGSKAGLMIDSGPSVSSAVHSAIKDAAEKKKQKIETIVYPEYLFVWPKNTILPIVSPRITFTIDSVTYIHLATIYYSESARHFSLGIKIGDVWYYYGMYKCIFFS